MTAKKILAAVLVLFAILIVPVWGENDLSLNVDGQSPYFKPGDIITIRMDVSNLQRQINGCQALIGYNSKYLAAPHQVAPGGGVWQELLYNVFNDVSGDLDTAIGIDLDSPVMGTSANGTVALLTFTAGAEGFTHLSFRENGDTGFETMFSDLNAQPIYPNKHNSIPICIDGTSPEIDIASAQQNEFELLSCRSNAVQGAVDIYVEASDSLSGLNGAPKVTVTQKNGVPVDAVLVDIDENGVFHYQFIVTAIMSNQVAQIDAIATDRSGNSAISHSFFNINKNQGLVNIELEELDCVVNTTRYVTFALTNSSNVVLETRVIPVRFAAHKSTALVTLADIDASVAHISAVTDWNLRRRLNITMDSDGQFSLDFTGNHKLLGGDFNQDNVTNLIDLSIIKEHWYTRDPIADITGDGRVNLTDLSIFKSNYYKKGDLN